MAGREPFPQLLFPGRMSFPQVFHNPLPTGGGRSRCASLGFPQTPGGPYYNDMVHG